MTMENPPSIRRIETSRDDAFAFDIAGSELSGTASLRGYGNRRGILDGSVAGHQLTFRATGQVQTDLFSVRNASYRYQGIVEGDSIRFRVVEEGTGDPAFSFTSGRITPPSPVSVGPQGVAANTARMHLSSEAILGVISTCSRPPAAPSVTV